jgi:hypothetical protein
MNIISPENFDVSKLEFDHNETTQELPFDIFFPEISDDYNSTSFFTDQIRLPFNLIKNIDDKFYPTDGHCLDFWLYLHQEDSTKLRNMFQGIDQFLSHQIQNNLSTKYITKINKKTWADVSVKQLKYIDCIRQFADTDYVDDKGDNNLKEYFNKIAGKDRIKIQLDTVFDQTKSKLDPKEIKTSIFLPVNTSVPLESREFSEPMKINSLDDVRNVCREGCTIRLLLKISKFWAMKNIDGKSKVRNCGLTIKCLQIYVCDDPKWNISKNTKK